MNTSTSVDLYISELAATEAYNSDISLKSIIGKAIDGIIGFIKKLITIFSNLSLVLKRRRANIAAFFRSRTGKGNIIRDRYDIVQIIIDSGEYIDQYTLDLKIMMDIDQYLNRGKKERIIPKVIHHEIGSPKDANSLRETQEKYLDLTGDITRLKGVLNELYQKAGTNSDATGTTNYTTESLREIIDSAYKKRLAEIGEIIHKLEISKQNYEDQHPMRAKTNNVPGLGKLTDTDNYKRIRDILQAAIDLQKIVYQFDGLYDLIIELSKNPTQEETEE